MKTQIVNSLVGLLVATVGTSAFASGFECSEPDGYNVKLYNRLDATRLPAVMVVSHGDASPSTLLVAKGEEISKTNRANTVRYSVDGSDMGAETVILQIAFKEGRETIPAGQSVDGQLIVVTEDSRDVIDLSCSRYLKHQD